MEPFDVKGRPIKPHIFRQLQKIGKTLEDLEWRESRNKPNLFYKVFNRVTVFADLRGTEIVPIWEQPYPYIYAINGFEEWERRRAIKVAVRDFDIGGIEYRFSFYDTSEPDGLFFGPDDEQTDGFCKMCGAEIKAGDIRTALFCSDQCDRAYSQLTEMRREVDENKIKCILCGKPLGAFNSDTIVHHIEYEPEEKTVRVCRSCHGKIHSNHEKYPDLAPSRPPNWKQLQRSDPNSEEFKEERLVEKSILDYDRLLKSFLRSGEKSLKCQIGDVGAEFARYYLVKAILDLGLSEKVSVRVEGKEVYMEKKELKTPSARKEANE